MNAAVTASTDSIVPASALRTGTAVRPCPGSRARRAPAVMVTGAADSHRASRGRRDAAVAPRRCEPWANARRQAGHAARATRSPRMAAAPTARTVMSALMPGAGSAGRAVPIGISGDAATATAAAATAPAAVATPTSISPLPIIWPRVMPSAASVGLSAALAASRRAATWPTMRNAVTMSTSAKRVSATASGRMARSTAAACACSSATNTCPCVPGNRRASASARRPKLPGVVPGFSFTTAPSAAR